MRDQEIIELIKDICEKNNNSIGQFNFEKSKNDKHLIELYLDIISNELMLYGINEDSKLNKYGEKIESAIDFLLNFLHKFD